MEMVCCSGLLYVVTGGMWCEFHALVWPDVSNWGLLELGGSCILSNHPVSAMNLISALNGLSLVSRHVILMSLPPVLYCKFYLAL